MACIPYELPLPVKGFLYRPDHPADQKDSGNAQQQAGDRSDQCGRPQHAPGTHDIQTFVQNDQLFLAIDRCKPVKLGTESSGSLSALCHKLCHFPDLFVRIQIRPVTGPAFYRVIGRQRHHIIIAQTRQRVFRILRLSCKGRSAAAVRAVSRSPFTGQLRYMPFIHPQADSPGSHRNDQDNRYNPEHPFYF